MERNEKDKILEVKNLRISFNTLNGTVKAVRHISFDLYRGRTLCIVGESGSGKSVTSRAIMGLLANNKIVEEGEILYDGKDLLRLGEDDFTDIRGSKISMIFQDPMSSLNPVMKVGKQISESMILKAKMSRKESKAKFKYLSKRIDEYAKQNNISFDKKKTYGEIKATAVKNELYNEATFVEIVKGLLKVNFDERVHNVDVASEKLKEVLDKKRVNEENLDVDNLKKVIKDISKSVSACENRLRRTRDANISAFGVSFKNCIVTYKNTVKREENAAKLEEKNKKKIAKGKKVEQKDSRAFASEIDTSSKSVARYAFDLVKKEIAYLALLKEKQFDNVDERVKNLIDYLEDSYRKSIERHPKSEYKKETIKLMKEVGIANPEKRINQYPFQFSGGMRQRIVIAIALASNPEILICDEPTTALDVTIQAQILELINKIKRDRNLSIIFITHNLGVVANMADDIAVMYAGKIIEYGTCDEIFYDPKHPYTWALLSSMPDLETKDRLDAIQGTPPNMIIPPKGDAFAARNKYALKIDLEEEPPLFKVSETHYAATWLLDERAPKVEPPKIVRDRIERMKKRAKTLEQEKGA